MMTLDCGCAYLLHEPTGLWRRTNRCAAHLRAFREPRLLGRAYYQELAVLDSQGHLADTRHVTEMTEALGPFPAAGANRQCLEIGCGVSPYVGALREAGWLYTGLDISPWAAHHNAVYWGAQAAPEDWERWEPPCKFGLILSAHSLEHMRDAPAAVIKMALHLEPGGRLIILVPDDRDPCNPDHNWLFEEMSLTRTVEAAGVEVMDLKRRKIVAREDFLYLLGRRP